MTSIFYNCGDRSFKYPISELYNGPNYMLKQVISEQNSKECEGNSCFFDFVNKDFNDDHYEARLDFTKCE